MEKMDVMDIIIQVFQDDKDYVSNKEIGRPLIIRNINVLTDDENDPFIVEVLHVNVGIYD